MKAESGAGTIEDIGIYCIKAARYIFQSEPISVFATSASNNEERFQEVAEMSSALLHFPGDRFATFTCSFGAARISSYQVMGTTDNLHVEPAYATEAHIKHVLSIEGEPKQEHSFDPHDRLAAVFLYFSDCILNDKEPEPSGKEGLIDIKIIRALAESIQTGTFVSLEGIEQRQHRPTVTQTIERPPLKKYPELIHAADPAGNS